MTAVYLDKQGKVNPNWSSSIVIVNGEVTEELEVIRSANMMIYRFPVTRTSHFDWISE